MRGLYATPEGASIRRRLVAPRPCHSRRGRGRPDRSQAGLPKANEYLSSSSGPGSRSPRRLVENIADRWGDAAGVPVCLPHRFRHSYVTKPLENGFAVRVVQSLSVTRTSSGRSSIPRSRMPRRAPPSSDCPGLCAGVLDHEEANGARMSRLAGVTALIELKRGQAPATGRIELGLTANSSFERPGLRREGLWASS